MGVYHRYIQYRILTGGLGYHSPYYHNYYYSNQCYGGCHSFSHCEYGICQCSYGYQRLEGQCVSEAEMYSLERSGRSQSFDPHITCLGTDVTCQNIDINLICVEDTDKCDCRNDMKWNNE